MSNHSNPYLHSPPHPPGGDAPGSGMHRSLGPLSSQGEGAPSSGRINKLGALALGRHAKHTSCPSHFIIWKANSWKTV